MSKYYKIQHYKILLKGLIGPVMILTMGIMINNRWVIIGSSAFIVLMVILAVISDRLTPDPHPHEFDRHVRCSGCGRNMFLISGVLMRSSQMSRIDQGFRCQACGRTTCYQCSNSMLPCKCGHNARVQTSYVFE